LRQNDLIKIAFCSIDPLTADVFIYPNVANQGHFIFPILGGLGTNLFAEGKKEDREQKKLFSIICPVLMFLLVVPLYDAM